MRKVADAVFAAHVVGEKNIQFLAICVAFAFRLAGVGENVAGQTRAATGWIVEAITIFDDAQVLALTLVTGDFAWAGCVAALAGLAALYAHEIGAALLFEAGLALADAVAASAVGATVGVAAAFGALTVAGFGSGKFAGGAPAASTGSDQHGQG